MYSGYKFFVEYVHCKHLLSLRNLYFLSRFVFFDELKLILLILMMSEFSFLASAFGVLKILPTTKSGKYYPVLSSRIFIILLFTFLPIINL